MKKYYGLDGDKVGGKIEEMFINNDEVTLKVLSEKINSAIQELVQSVIKDNGKVIFSGGDSLLFKGIHTDEFCDGLIDRFYKLTGCTASMGIGDSLKNTLLSMKIAKAKGGNMKIVDLKESKNV